MARVMRRQGEYLRREADRSLLTCLAGLLAGLLAVVVHPLLVLLGFIPLARVVMSSYQRYARYRKGFHGEQEVSRALQNLGDTYYVVNDARIPGGNIDHIVLGPNGVFVLETKNFTGRVRCEGDRWVDRRDRDIRRSPSLQVKRNAARVRERVREFERTLLKEFPRIGWVHAMVVLSDPEVQVNLRSPAVQVVRVGELVDAIKATPSSVNLPPAALTKIGLALQGMGGVNARSPVP